MRLFSALKVIAAHPINKQLVRLLGKLSAKEWAVKSHQSCLRRSSFIAQQSGMKAANIRG